MLFGNVDFWHACRAWRENFKKASGLMTKSRTTLSFNKIMTSSTPAKRPNKGFKTMNAELCTGLHNPQTITPLISLVSSKKKAGRV